MSSEISGTARREFLRLGAAALASRASYARVVGANGRVAVGVIGIGFRANLLIDQLPKPGEVVALCDCNVPLAEQAAAKRNAKWEIYEDYRRLLDRKDIDAVIVATHDAGRVMPCIHACQAGKDVYAEKPLTLYPGEGTVLVKAARRYKTVFQVGTQQRSMEMNQVACRLVRSGRLGRLTLVRGLLYTDAKPLPDVLPEDPRPDRLNWDFWTGQTRLRPYSTRLHKGWGGWQEYGGGDMTNWGAHGLDIVQMALGMDHSGPIEFWPMESPPGGVAFRYATGVEVRLELPRNKENEYLQGGARFLCEKGAMDIWRNDFKLDAAGVVPDMPSDADIQKWHDSRALWQAQYHMGHWLECIASRQRPNADVEIGHRSVSVCLLANLARRLNRKIRWDPRKEQVIGDKEANLLATARPRRKGWELPKL